MKDINDINEINESVGLIYFILDME